MSDPFAPPPARSRGSIALIEEACTSCMLCVRECPDWCIHLEAHQEVEPAEGPGARPRTRNVLDRFAIDYSLCMYCGICVEVCPFDALAWSPELVPPGATVVELTLERDGLGAFRGSVPEPPPLDPGAPPPEDAAERPR